MPALSRQRLALPGGAVWPSDHEPRATGQHDVRGAEQRRAVMFDAEEGGPDQISYTAAAKDHGSQHGEAVAAGEGTLPRPATYSLVHEDPGKGTSERQKSAVEDGMPGCEKGRI